MGPAYDWWLRNYANLPMERVYVGLSVSLFISLTQSLFLSVCLSLSLSFLSLYFSLFVWVLRTVQYVLIIIFIIISNDLRKLEEVLMRRGTR